MVGCSIVMFAFRGGVRDSFLGVCGSLNTKIRVAFELKGKLEISPMLHPRSLTASLPLKNGAWKTFSFPFWHGKKLSMSMFNFQGVFFLFFFATDFFFGGDVRRLEALCFKVGVFFVCFRVFPFWWWNIGCI